MALQVMLVHYGLSGFPVSDPKLAPLALKACWRKAIKLSKEMSPVHCSEGNPCDCCYLD